jgi:hypothetical protein
VLGAGCWAQGVGHNILRGPILIFQPITGHRKIKGVARFPPVVKYFHTLNILIELSHN